MTTIFTVMSALAQQHGAINLSQGFPDFPIDDALADAVAAAMREGHNQYAPMAGLPALRDAIAADFARRYRVAINVDTEITVTPGATYAIYNAFAAILRPGDEAIILEPAYDSYKPNIEMCGAVPVPVALNPPDFAPDWQKIADAITPRTRAIIVNTPHNPTGAVWSREDWDELAKLIDGQEIYVLSDEVYEQLIYDDVPHFSVLQHAALRERSFALYSFGKVFHNTGWKIGYCIAPPALTAAFRHIHQFLAFSVNTPMQQGIATYLSGEKRLPAAPMMQAKRDLFLGLMEDSLFAAAKPAGGSYFQLFSNYQFLSHHPEAPRGDRAFAEWLTKTHGVATIPISAFYTDGRDTNLLRFCFAKKEETLLAAAERLAFQ